MWNGLEKNVQTERQQETQIRKAAQELRSSKTKSEGVARCAFAETDAMCVPCNTNLQENKLKTMQTRIAAFLCMHARKPRRKHCETRRPSMRASRAKWRVPVQPHNRLPSIQSTLQMPPLSLLLVCRCFGLLTRCAPPDARS